MHAELPTACSLTPAELPARLAEMRALARRALLSAEHTDDGAVLSFAVMRKRVRVSKRWCGLSPSAAPSWTSSSASPATPWC
jgi:hypothetical protein